jgi:hypothetical protein
VSAPTSRDLRQARRRAAVLNNVELSAWLAAFEQMRGPMAPETRGAIRGLLLLPKAERHVVATLLGLDDQAFARFRDELLAQGSRV